MAHKVMGFVDGENLVFRYQAMLADGLIPKAGIVHEPDVLVWHPEVTTMCFCDFVRLAYYQTVVGDDVRLNSVRQKIQLVEYQYRDNDEDAKSSIRSTGVLAPRVFKKENKHAKTKSVDISLTIDMLRHASQPHFDVLFLFSGDGDYLPLVEEVSRSGKQLWLGAFSKGLNPRLRYAADEFFDLDDVFFKSTKSANQKTSPRG